MKNYFKTKKRLSVAIEYADRIDGMNEYLENNFRYLYMDSNKKEKYYPVPYWLENFDSEGLVEYRTGYHESMSIGDKITDSDVNYIYVDSVLLPEEIEHRPPTVV